MRVVLETEREDEERKRLIGPGTKASLILTVYGKAAGLEPFGNVTPQTDSNRFFTVHQQHGAQEWTQSRRYLVREMEYFRVWL